MIVEIPDPRYPGVVILYDLELGIGSKRQLPTGEVVVIDSPYMPRPKKVWKKRLKRWGINPWAYHPDLKMDSGL